MDQGKQHLKFDRNPCNTFTDNRYATEWDGRMNDVQTNFDFLSSADLVKQS